jgi:hypothetical protein
MPGYWGGCKPDQLDSSHRVICHEAQESDQSWNSKTQWSEEGVEPGILSGPFASNFTAFGTDARATITWTTRNSSSSYVDYGFTSGYGFTTGIDNNVTNHSITLTGLTNHTTYHYRVRSHDGVDWIESDDREFYISVPPTVPVKGANPVATCYEPCDITFSWNTSTDPDSGPIEYFVEANDPDIGGIYTSGWTTDTEWTVTLPLGYWCWKVKAHDANHTEAESAWSNSSCFNTAPAPSIPAPIDEPDIVSPGPVTVTLWMPSTSPLGNPVEYQVEVYETVTWTWYTSDWISGTSFTINLDTENWWRWRVRARDAVYQHAFSGWSTIDLFAIVTSNPPPAPTLIDEPDVITSVPIDVTLEWNQVSDPDGDPVEYQVWVSESGIFSPREESGWMTEGEANCVAGKCSWTVTLDPLKIWYWRVQARDAVHTDKVSAWSGVDSFNTWSSNPPPVPTLIPEPDFVGNGLVDVTVEWYQVSDPDGDPVEYYVDVFWSIWQPNSSGWMTEAKALCDGSTCSWTVTIDTTGHRTWSWRVQARDADHTEAVSELSTYDTFIVLTSNPPPTPTLIDEPDVIMDVPLSITLEWDEAIDPDGDPVQYTVEIDTLTNFFFWNPDFQTSGWISGNCSGNICSWTVTLGSATTWHWRVKARDAAHTVEESSWSTVDSFDITEAL